MNVIRWLGVLLVGMGGFSSGALPARAPAAAAPSASRGAPPRGGEIPETRIAAVVNDEAISIGDLRSRVRMVMLSSNLAPTPDTEKRVTAQVLRTIVDEKLQMQEARRLNVTASDDEVKKAIASIEKQNNMQPAQLDAALKAHGIERSALVDQVTASVVWAKLVRRLASQTNPVSDEEIDDALNRIKQNANEPQSRVAEIFLAVDNPQQDAEVRQLAERLTEQMKRGARFSAIAQQFSQSATAAVGGDLGWVRSEQLSPDLAKAVDKLRPGELSSPIRTGPGYYLVLVLDRRGGRAGNGGAEAEDTVLRIVQVVFALPPQAGEAAKRAAVAEAQNTKAVAKNCEDMLRIGREKAPQLSSEGTVRLSQIAPQMRSLVLGLGIGQPSQPILQKNGVGVIMVCEKKATGGPAAPPTREEVTESLVRQRLDTLARRYMRDLRRTAFVDVRG